MFENDEDITTSSTQENYSEPTAAPRITLAPALPFRNGSGEQYEMIREYRELAKQNFKMLLLTNPGERVMDANFGVGIRRYLFELDDENVRSAIAERIEDQVAEYLPYIYITSLTFPLDQETNTLRVKIVYEVSTLDSVEEMIIG